VACASAACDAGWNEIDYGNGGVKCVAAFNEHLTWDQAEAKCEQRGARLVETHSAAEDARVAQIIRDTKTDIDGRVNDGNTRGSWTGARRVNNGGVYDFQYRSLCGNRDYSNWAPNQPDNAGGNENCVERLNANTGAGQWNDLDCGQQDYYACEKTNGVQQCNNANYNQYAANNGANNGANGGNNGGNGVNGGNTGTNGAGNNGGVNGANGGGNNVVDQGTIQNGQMVPNGGNNGGYNGGNGGNGGNNVVDQGTIQNGRMVSNNGGANGGNGGNNVVDQGRIVNGRRVSDWGYNNRYGYNDYYNNYY